jgi:hypothetical protein
MDAENFVRWALDDSRTLEERYTTELLVEVGVNWWLRDHNMYKHEGFETILERNRQRALNPAYEPRYTEESLRRTAEKAALFKMWSAYGGLEDRPVRDIKVLQFFPVEDLRLNRVEVADISVLTQMPRLRSLHLGSLICEDLRPLANCTQLKELYLTLHKHWPNVTGLERLTQLEVLSLTGNLLAFEAGISWTHVRTGILKCEPLAARSVRDLPQLPACQELTLGGIERLDGIESFPALRNLTIETDVRDFTPLQALTELTCFTCKASEPLDIAPLTRLPKLLFASFDTRYKASLRAQRPRDFSTLIDAPQLREVVVEGCAPVKTEVAALNAGLPSWDDLFLLPEPRELKPLRVIVAPHQKLPRRPAQFIGTDEPAMIDKGLRQCEERWVQRYVKRSLNKRLGCSDWGEITTNGMARGLGVTIEAFSMVDKLPKFLEATRAVLAKLRPEYQATVMIHLKAPQREPTPAELELEEKFREEQDNAEFERRQREQEEYLERLHRYELKKQEGQAIKPEEFAPGAKKPLPPAPWEVEDEEEDSDDPHSGDLAIKKKPEPPPQFLDDEHPLADNYRLMAELTLTEAWFTDRDKSLVTYLLGRAPDLVIPSEETK